MGRVTSMIAVAAGLSDVGRQREHNEDSFAVDLEHGLFVVADGMGGHASGDVASRVATTTIAEFFRTLGAEDVTWPSHFDRTLSDEENRLLTSIGIANRRIFEQSLAMRSLSGMGTTVVGAHFSSRRRRMYFGHVGDSRAYRIRRGDIRQLTRDHSLANEPFPELTDEERAELPKNVITRALGMQDNVVVDLTVDDVEAGDVYLLCSDGLTGMLEDDEILRSIDGLRQSLGARTASTDEILEACADLVQRANDAGGDDNVTALLVRIEAVSSADSDTPPAMSAVAPGASPSAPLARSLPEEDSIPESVTAPGALPPEVQFGAAAGNQAEPTAGSLGVAADAEPPHDPALDATAEMPVPPVPDDLTGED